MDVRAAVSLSLSSLFDVNFLHTDRTEYVLSDRAGVTVRIFSSLSLSSDCQGQEVLPQCSAVRPPLRTSPESTRFASPLPSLLSFSPHSLHSLSGEFRCLPPVFLPLESLKASLPNLLELSQKVILKRKSQK